MTAIWVNMIIGGILLFYLSGILVVIGLLIAKVTERQRERKTEKEKFKDYLKPINIEMSKSGKIATHADLLDFIKKGDEKGYRDAIERHFEVYKIFKVNRSQELMAEKESSEKVEGI